MPSTRILSVIAVVIIAAVGALLLLAPSMQPTPNTPERDVQPDVQAQVRDEPRVVQPAPVQVAPPPPQEVMQVAPAVEPPPAPREEPAPAPAPRVEPAPPPAPPQMPEPAPVVLEGRVEITIDKFKFAPAQITIRRGTEVVWIMRDVGDDPLYPPIHLVNAERGEFISMPLEIGGQFRFVFETTGTFNYFCRYHPQMTAKIVVVE